MPPNKYEYPADSIITYFSYILLLNTMIPISLIITLEIVKMIQGYFISVDCLGYSKIRKEFIKAGSISLNEELGNVNFIFSDKTGTLTCNKMNFKYGIIKDQCFDLSTESESKDVYIDDSMFIHSSSKLIYNHETITYFNMLALTNECEIQENEKNEIEYNGASPDDIELIKTSSRYGYVSLPNNIPGVKSVKQQSSGISDFSIDFTIEFTSKRKRMTIIFSPYNQTEDPSQKQEYYVFTKGADVEISKRLKKMNDKELSELDRCKRYISYFSNQGLRVLMLARKTITKEEFEDFKAKHDQSALNLLNKELLIEKICDEFESDFELLGATIVEDKLQDEVPETIQQLKLADIKIWMLTGDSVETARNIGLSCNLIGYKDKVFEVQSSKESDIKQVVEEYYQYIDNIIYEKEQKIINNHHVYNNNFENSIQESSFCNDSKNEIDFSLIMSSDALTKILNSVSLCKKIMTVASQAKSVICCRVSPLQKASIIKEMMKFDKKAKTLAIGDGGNDVSMILEANIGVGVYGEEGMRAVQASDYAIGEFKILQRLLFFHGRLSLLRISKLLYYFFFKNISFTLSHFFFLFINNASGQSIFEDWFITLYNLIYTSIPIGILACSEIDIRSEDGILIDKLNPFIYKASRDNPLFTKAGFIIELIRGSVIGLIMFLVIKYSIENTAFNDKGDIACLWSFSYIYFTSIFMLVSFTLLIRTQYHTVISISVMIFISWMIYFLSLVFFHNNISTKSSGTYSILLASIKIYLIIVLNVMIGLIIELGIINIKYLYLPNITNILEVMRVTDNRIVNDLNLAKSQSIFNYYLEKYDLKKID